jgi:hypothetical protein
MTRSDSRKDPLKVAVDQSVDMKPLWRLQRSGRIVLFQAHDLEQSFRDVLAQGRPFRIEESALDGPDMWADENFAEVESLIGRGREKRADVEHVYAAWLNQCDYFGTNDSTDFIRNGRREQLEQLLRGVRIRRLEESLREAEKAEAG